MSNMVEEPAAASEDKHHDPIPWVDLKFRGRESKERKEHSQLERDGIQSHNIRRLAAYGALLLALVLYVAGLFSVALMLGFVGGERFSADMWHIATVIVMALFTVPTLLVLAVLRASAKSSESKDIVIVHERIGQVVLKFLEKLASK